ncbi:MAG: DNA/RNA non-specific endonuclease [Cyanobacteriota bacterium]|nr:DNA/RNA non-specific endonuclease [Cyanobacteriota bacterium]
MDGSVESIARDDFRPDSDLPNGCYAVRSTDYRGSGYDRGHLAPSGDPAGIWLRQRALKDSQITVLLL